MGLERLDFRYAHRFCVDVQAAVLGEDSADPDYPEYFLPNEDVEFLKKAAVPHRETLLHDYIYEVAADGIDYIIGHGDRESFVEFRSLIQSADLAVPDWLNEDEVEDHQHDLDLLAREAARLIVPAAFHLLYADLRFLQAFQRLVAQRTNSLRQVDYPEFLHGDGVLIRPGNWPMWLRNGVFHRDKGRCQDCYRDLTGTINLEGKVHIDHIMPLARGGSNDPTNLQILCDECNRRKATADVDGNWHTETYW